MSEENRPHEPEPNDEARQGGRAEPSAREAAPHRESSRTSGGYNQEESLRSLTLIVYVLQGLGFFNGLTFIAGAILNYIKKEDAQGTIYQSHFTWQLRTFWWGVLWTMLGAVTSIIFIGYFILTLNAIWVIYRIAKGFIYWNEQRPLPMKEVV